MRLLFYTSIVLLLSIFIAPKAFAQFSIQKFPKDLQLFPRDDNNKAIVSILGSTTSNAYQKVLLAIYKNDGLVQTLEQNINNTPFTFNFDVSINAELSEYTFKLYLQSGSTQTLIKQATRVVCGDAILLYGQSNMVAIVGIDEFNANWSDQFMRNFDFPDPNNNTPENLSWYSAKYPYAQVGTIGCFLMKHLQDSYHVPLCVINPSVGGFTVDNLTSVNPNNHFDTNHYYGKMLTRLRDAGLLNSLKLMAYRQGENEASGYYLTCNQYPNKFDILYNQLMADIPSLRKIYILQNNILGGGYVERAGYLRDFQRRTKEIYPNVDALATVGTINYGGIHYWSEGYKQTAYELYRLIARDFYGSTDVHQINSPNIQKAYYSANKDSLTLVFDEGQVMKYPQDSSIFGVYTRSMKDFIYLNSDNQRIDFNESNHPVVAGTAVDNKIILKLNAPSNELYVTYLPSTFSDNNKEFYDGVHLTNAKGMRAFSFYEIPISNSAPPINTIPKTPSNLITTAISPSQINLNWIDNSNNETSFILEGSYDGTNYTIAQNIAANTINIFQTNLIKNTKYYFRIKACNALGCSSYSNLGVATTMNSSIFPCISLNLTYTIANTEFNVKGVSIIANNKVISQSKVFYTAPSISLQPGFYVEKNSIFETKIEGCNN